MNSKQVFIGLVGVVVAGVLIAMQSGGGGVLPPEPDPVPVVDEIAQIAADGIATFAKAGGDLEVKWAAKLRAGDFKDSSDAAKWREAQFAAIRKEAFRKYGAALDQAKRVSETEESLEKLADAAERAAPGWHSIGRGK